MLGFARQSYYEWLENPYSQRDWDDAHLANVLFDLHHDDPPFGYRFLADELKDRGHAVGENRVHWIGKRSDLVDDHQEGYEGRRQVARSRGE